MNEEVYKITKNQIVEMIRPILNEKDKEIERLNNVIVFDEKEIQSLTESNNKLEMDNNRLNNIIKEVREYIKEMPNNEYIGYWKKEIFEILDKVGSDKE